MTTSAKQDKTQDWRRIARHLADYDLRLDLKAGAYALSGGSANLNFRITLNDCQAVLRRPPAGTGSQGAHAITREFEVLSGLDGFYAYTPKAIHHCANPEIIGVPFCISEFRGGEAIGKTMPTSFAAIPGIGQHLGMIVIQAIAALHAVDPDEAGLTHLGSPQGFLKRQIDGWYKRGMCTFVDRDAAMATAIHNWLFVHLPPASATAIIHNDFKLDNILVDPETLQVNAVLDWDMCTLGDPLYDFTILLLYWGQRDDDDLHRDMAEMPFTADGWMSRLEAVEHYRRLSDQDLTPEKLKFYWILAQLRLAGVMAQLLALYHAGKLRTARINETTAVQVRRHISAILSNAFNLLPRDLNL